jgi:succinate dehydrogenase/fumarate reductase cytochrome b subunit
LPQGQSLPSIPRAAFSHSASLGKPTACQVCYNFLTHKAVVVVLLAFLIYHTLNGIRGLIVDFGNGALYHKKLYWVMMVIGLVFFAAGLYAI